MPKTKTLDVRLYCINCKEYTQSISPINIIKVAKIRFILKQCV